MICGNIRGTRRSGPDARRPSLMATCGESGQSPTPQPMAAGDERVCQFSWRGAAFRLHSPHFLTPTPLHKIQHGLTPDLLATPPRGVPDFIGRSPSCDSPVFFVFFCAYQRSRPPDVIRCRHCGLGTCRARRPTPCDGECIESGGCKFPPGRCSGP